MSRPIPPTRGMTFDHAVVRFPLSYFENLHDGQQLARVDGPGKVYQVPTVIHRESGCVDIATSKLGEFTAVGYLATISFVPNNDTDLSLFQPIAIDTAGQPTNDTTIPSLSRDPLCRDPRFMDDTPWWGSATMNPSSTYYDKTTDVHIWFSGTSSTPPVTITTTSTGTSITPSTSPHQCPLPFEYAIISFPRAMFPSLAPGQHLARVEASGHVVLLPTHIDSVNHRVVVATSDFCLFCIPVIIATGLFIPISLSAAEDPTTWDVVRIIGEISACAGVGACPGCGAALVECAEAVGGSTLLPVAGQLGAAVFCIGIAAGPCVKCAGGIAGCYGTVRDMIKVANEKKNTGK